MLRHQSITTFLSLTIILFPHIAFAQQTQTFGQRGNSGQNGYNGRIGQNGQNQNITVENNTPQTYDLSGKNGEDGTDGQYGNHASNCQQPINVTYNLRGANGGDGGNGGNGGDGGDGGDFNLYYTDVSALKNITIDNSGGERGRSGRGAEGGQGCPVSQQYWQIKICGWELQQRRTDVENAQWQRANNKNQRTYCKGVKRVDERNYVPNFPRANKNIAQQWKYLGVVSTENYQAKAGNEGETGNDGKTGNNGNYGDVTLIPRTDIPAENVSYQNTLSNLIGNKIDLARNIWVQKQDLSSLLNRASDVPNNYTYLLDTAYLSYQIDWQTTKTPEQLEINNLNLDGKITLNNLQPKIAFNLDKIPGTIDYQVQTQDDLTRLTITGGFAPSRVESFRLDNFIPAQFEQIVLVDDGKVRELLTNTSIIVKTHKKIATGEYSLRDTVTFDIPPEKLPRGNMSVEDNQYTLNIGRNLFPWMNTGSDILYTIIIEQKTKRGVVYQQEIETNFIIP